MNFELRDYQTESVAELLEELEDAQSVYARRGKMSAIGLTAPTGAGKTVMAAAVIEELFEKDPDLTIIWLSDAPELNRQSQQKIDAASNRITPFQLRFLTELDQRQLDPGTIVFAHIQSLGKGAKSMHAVNTARDGSKELNDARTFGVWDILANTVNARGLKVILIVDEAHRGIGNGSTVSGQERKTITSTVVHGGETPSGTVMPPCPIVLGISATPQRFNDAMSAPGSRHAHTTVGVDLVKVRRSGLLKDVINVPAPAEAQNADHTLLAAAAAELKLVTEKWAAYSEETGAPLVLPCMVIQVPSAMPNQDAQLKEILSTLKKTWGELTDKAIAHTFDTHTDIQIDGEEIRYVRPSDVASQSTGVRAVLFKTALTTGWDCPRAEVMVSLRGANDPTTIAQLIGRMVRTPLARRIDDGDDALNAVTLWLPHYEEGAVAAVVDALTKDEDIAGAGTEIRIGTADCPRNSHVPDQAFQLIAALPSAVRPTRRFATTAQRARRLAGLLKDYEIADGPNADLDAEFLGAVRTEAAKRSAEVKNTVADLLTLEMRRTRHTADGEGYSASESPDVSLPTAKVDLQRAFERATKTLPDNSAMLYYQTLSGMDDREDLATIIALSLTPDVVTAVENAASRQITSWKDEYSSTVQRRTSTVQMEFAALWNANRDLLPASVTLPSELKKVGTQKTATVGGQRSLVPLDCFPKHLFALPASDNFPVKYGSSWEEKVLHAEVGQESVVAWYRNPSRGVNALAIPYKLDDETGLLYPDFLFVRNPGDGNLVIDVVDPHLHSSADAGPKWRGLAAWAAKYSAESWLGRVVAVIEMNNDLRALDLRDSKVVNALDAVHTKPDIERVFKDLATAY